MGPLLAFPHLVWRRRCKSSWTKGPEGALSNSYMASVLNSKFVTMSHARANNVSFARTISSVRNATTLFRVLGVVNKDPAFVAMKNLTSPTIEEGSSFRRQTSPSLERRQPDGEGGTVLGFSRANT